MATFSPARIRTETFFSVGGSVGENPKLASESCDCAAEPTRICAAGRLQGGREHVVQPLEVIPEVLELAHRPQERLERRHEHALQRQERGERAERHALGHHLLAADEEDEGRAEPLQQHGGVAGVDPQLPALERAVDPPRHAVRPALDHAALCAARLRGLETAERLEERAVLAPGRGELRGHRELAALAHDEEQDDAHRCETHDDEAEPPVEREHQRRVPDEQQAVEQGGDGLAADQVLDGGVAVDALDQVARLALHEEAERQVEQVVQEPRHEGEVEDGPEPLHHEAPHDREERLREHGRGESESQAPEHRGLVGDDDRVHQDLSGDREQEAHDLEPERREQDLDEARERPAEDLAVLAEARPRARSRLQRRRRREHERDAREVTTHLVEGDGAPAARGVHENGVRGRQALQDEEVIEVPVQDGRERELPDLLHLDADSLGGSP